MPTELTLPVARNEIAKYVAENVERLIPLLRQSMVDRQQFAAAIVVAANELKEDSCTPQSVLVAAAHAAMIGLVPGRSLRLAYFIPRKLRRSDAMARCNLEISYQGYINLATRNRFLCYVYADVVLQGEDFKVGVQASQPVIDHDQHPDRDLETRSLRQRMIGAYCCYETTNGGRSHLYMSRAQIDAVQERHGGALWEGPHYYSMVRKTPVRAAANFWRLTPELSMAMRLDDQSELSEPQDLGAGLELPGPESSSFSLKDMAETPVGAEEEAG